MPSMKGRTTLTRVPSQREEHVGSSVKVKTGVVAASKAAADKVKLIPQNSQ